MIDFSLVFQVCFGVPMKTINILFRRFGLRRIWLGAGLWLISGFMTSLSAHESAVPHVHPHVVDGGLPVGFLIAMMIVLVGSLTIALHLYSPSDSKVAGS
jgi:hypothetical protein